MSSNENRKEEFIFSDEEDRPYIARSYVNPEFRVGDKVYVLGSDRSQDGPYLVELVISDKECTLSFENGQTAKDGKAVQMAILEKCYIA
ncbi:hypothetical protein B0H65DRAFT_477868 [Neurospora tetraspora]|uniref:Uncharacterized protein n=1 Tax=Neurospora tetraspora TaxID=94610 RepID=A0AAE0J7R9_9PEZI|nr:hypothetical protein B0H65DRAFT_477868 [Neurospora tetraspora]